ncbi:helix-turn-helix domain-containing protein [Pectinatus haikarae]|uniref:helix-turn-helix domain-containing protein n=1 Tax=Pectinatus haikarae TaxID=349096 RepID=UPI0018C49469|nr:helix-turn-helix transcriptional regulator [Pectinatus haikarae]
MIAKRIKTLRSEQNLTQRELSARLNLTPKMISFYELGQRTPPSDIIIKLTEIFNVSADYLLGKTDIKESADNILNEGNKNEFAKKDTMDLAKFLDQTEIMFDGEVHKLDFESRQRLRNALEFAFYEAKKMNKRKKD